MNKYIKLFWALILMPVFIQAQSTKIEVFNSENEVVATFNLIVSVKCK